MPSRQVVGVSVPHEDTAKDVPIQSSVTFATGEAAQSAEKKKPTQTSQRKITPTQDPAAADNPKPKKQQATLASFFGKAKFPSTPSVATKEKTTKKKPAPKPKSQPSKADPPTENRPPKTNPPASKSITPTAATTATSKKPPGSIASRRSTKMDYKDIVIGRKSSCRKPSIIITHSIESPEDDDLDALLPRIPPLSAVQTTQKSSMSPQSVDMDDSETGEEKEIGGIRSQLVHKFESPLVESKKEDTRAKQEEDETESSPKPVEQEVIDVDMEESDDAQNNEPDTASTQKNPNDDILVDLQDDDDTQAKEKKADLELEDANNERSNCNHDTPQTCKETSLHSKSERTASPPPSGTTESANLDAESSQLLRKHEAMRVKYCEQASKLVLQAHEKFEEEAFEITTPSTQNVTLSSGTEFPDEAVPHLVCLLEGSDLPLTKLANLASDSLEKTFGGNRFTVDAVSSKIKVLAVRKNYIKNPAISSGLPLKETATDIFEDANPDHMWRWEITTLELLPDAAVKSAKAARAVRKKLQNRFNATAKLIAALNESIKLLGDPTTKPPKSKIEQCVSKISKEEEKVLKFEQEAEKARLQAEAKKLKEAQKYLKSKEEKERVKEEKRKAVEEKKREKEEAKQKKLEEKHKKTLEKEEAKRQKEEKERHSQLEKEKSLEKQRKRMMSFFAGGTKKPKIEAVVSKPTVKAPPGVKESSAKSQQIGFDSDKFQVGINSLVSVDKGSLFSSLSKRAVASRKRKAKIVKMRVFVSGVNADDPFAAQPAFAEERIVNIRNRNKFLLFHEDCRPPYHGTWSKRSAKCMGRNPFFKESCLDYDVDSEAEWEEGDDDPGEDVENDADDEDEKLMDEEGDTRVYNYQDGWLAEDDDIIGVDEPEEEIDEQTKNLVKASKRRGDVAFIPSCVVAPAPGGRPIVEEFKSAGEPLLKNLVEGFPVEDAYKLVASHTGAFLTETDLFLDAFPPALTEEREVASETVAAQTSQPSDEDMQTIAKFVHHSKLASKSQVVEELRNTHASVTSSRAQAHRILDSIAEKKRLPTAGGGVYWEVKQDVIDNLGLGGELKPMEIPDDSAKAPKKDGNKKRKKSEGTADSAVKKAKTVAPLECSATKSADNSAKSAASITKSQGSAKKKPHVSAASANLLSAFLIKSKKKN